MYPFPLNIREKVSTQKALFVRFIFSHLEVELFTLTCIFDVFSEEKDPHLHGNSNSHILRVNMPSKNRRGISPDRTHSLAIDDRIPIRPEKSLSKLNSDKPKFTVRKPYIDREVRDKKAQSESWVPSYV